MISTSWFGYLLAFGAASVATVILTPLAMWISHRFGVFDWPRDHKSHSEPTAHLGGMAMLVAFIVSVAGAAALHPLSTGPGTLFAILGIALALAMIGLVDDLKGLGITSRLLSQIAAGVALWVVGTRVSVTGIDWLDLVITVVWVVGITNAMNLLDNMDGLSAGIAGVAALSFGVLGAINGQFLVAGLAFALAGCSLGFLVHNRPPARIYMGDAGSLFLGFILATVGIRLSFRVDPVSAALIPILVLTVPVMDTTLVTFSRLRNGLSPLVGGRDHMSHRLVRLGLSVPVAVATIVALGVAHGWAALIVSRVDTATALLTAGLIFVIDALLFALLASIPVYENSRGGEITITRRSPRGREAS